MTTATETKKCLSCGKAIKGRADKKFCDDACRNAYNNELKTKSNYSNYVRNINNTLLKNRRILEEILTDAEETAKTTHDRLIQKGFVFKYHTHTYSNKKGNIYFFNYDYGYLQLENNWYLIVRRKEEQ